VGDAEFQKKCLGKMKDVATGGRTVLFVSHNMSAVQSLCSRSILLEQGHVIFAGKALDAVKKYLRMSYSSTAESGEKRQLSKIITLADFKCDPMVVGRNSKAVFSLVLESAAVETISDLAILIHAPGGERAALIDLRSPHGPIRLVRGGQVLVRAEVLDMPFVENDFSVGLYLNADSVTHSFMNLFTFSVAPDVGDTKIIPRDAQFRGLVELRAKVSHS